MRLLVAIVLSCLATAQGFVGVVAPTKQTQPGGRLRPIMMVLKNPNNYDGSAVSADTSTDKWIKEGIESQTKDEVVVGPDHVLVYDTTLRGKCCRQEQKTYLPPIPVTHPQPLLSAPNL